MLHRCDQDAGKHAWKKNMRDAFVVQKGNAVKLNKCYITAFVRYFTVSSVCAPRAEEGDQLINWVTGLLRGNRMQIESGHDGDSRRACVLPLALFLHKRPSVIQSEKCADRINRKAHARTICEATSTYTFPSWSVVSQPGLAPGVPQGTYLLHSHFCQWRQAVGEGAEWGGVGEECLEILTCHFPPCENAVAAEWVSIKKNIALMCGKGNLSAAGGAGGDYRNDWSTSSRLKKRASHQPIKQSAAAICMWEYALYHTHTPTHTL